MTPARWVAAVGVCALLVTFALALGRSEPRLSGTNWTPSLAYIVGLPPGKQACQASELLPGDTGAIQFMLGTSGRPGPPVSVTATGPAGRLLTSGALPAGWRQGPVRIPVRKVSSAHLNAKVCVRVAPAAAGGYQIALAGNRNLGSTMEVAGQQVPSARVRIDYYRPGSESWYALLPAIVHRFSIAKAGFLRHWEWWAALALILATAFLAIRTVLRSAATSEPRS